MFDTSLLRRTKQRSRRILEANPTLYITWLLSGQRLYIVYIRHACHTHTHTWRASIVAFPPLPACGYPLSIPGVVLCCGYAQPPHDRVIPQCMQAGQYRPPKQPSGALSPDLPRAQRVVFLSRDWLLLSLPAAAVSGLPVRCCRRTHRALAGFASTSRPLRHRPGVSSRTRVWRARPLVRRAPAPSSVRPHWQRPRHSLAAIASSVVSLPQHFFVARPLCVAWDRSIAC